MGTYNQAPFLREALDSLLQQTYRNLQIIVVNDGSTDETAAILESYDDPRLEILSLSANEGMPRAYNRGFARVRGEYTTWTSSDNVSDPRQIEVLLQALRAHPQYRLAYSDYRYLGALTGDYRVGPVEADAIYHEGKTIGASFLFRTELLREKPGPPFDEALAGVEDTAMWLDFSRLTKFLYVPQVLYGYRLHPGQITGRIRATTGYAPLLARMRDRYQAKYGPDWQCAFPPPHGPHQRVLFVYCFALHGGVETVLGETIKALREQGFEAEVGVLEDYGGAKLFAGLCPCHVIGSSEQEVVVPQLAELLRRGNFDLVHQIAPPLTYAAVGAAGFSGPVVAACHGNVALARASPRW
jgi:hypothetical protein